MHCVTTPHEQIESPQLLASHNGKVKSRGCAFARIQRGRILEQMGCVNKGVAGAQSN